MENIFQELKDHWEVVVAIITGLWVIWSYKNTQRASLASSRTSLLFEQSDIFETDPEIKEAILILEGRHSKYEIPDLFSTEGEPNNSPHGEIIQKMDRMLNLLQRLGYATITLKTLNQSETELFGWYYSKIIESSRLTKYCDKYGFGCVVEFAHKI